eukprot:TRINITY_DN92050_c0_g1_i1.p1 TRINITY_DN92050_c0_g1~~TRINITY_DN92050_c0_g1_i1.p1  ORF type:complete len:980 (+),score=196.00 TRINITY_DN92050_c0_g1_i1:136-3075(+)
MSAYGGSRDGSQLDRSAGSTGPLHQFLSAEIPSTESAALDRWKPVTLYQVRITALGRREVWMVVRRYSKFYDLHVQLTKRFFNHSLPPIPPKRLLGKEDPQFIEQRRHELEEFLNALLRKPVEISLSEEMCLFLEVPEPLRLCFLEADARGPTFLPLPGEEPMDDDIADSLPDDCRVTWLLAQLQEQPLRKVFFIRTFEEWFLRTKEKRSPLTEANAQLLYLGIEHQGGLLEEVGAFKHSEASSVAALSLLCKLLSHEYCSEATLLRAVLSRLDMSILVRMRLQHHIHRNRGQNNRLDAFRVLKALELRPEELMAILQDDFSLREFRRWQESLQSSLTLRTLHQPAQPKNKVSAAIAAELREPPRKPLSSREYRKLAESAFTSVQMCLTTFVLPDGEVSVAASPSLSSTDHATLRPSVGAGSVSLGLEGDSVSVGAVSTPVSASAAVAASTPAAQHSAVAAGGLPPGLAMSAAGDPSHSAAPTEAASRKDAANKQPWQQVPCPEASWVTKYGLRAAYHHCPYEQQLDAYVIRATMRLPFPAFFVAALVADHSEFIKEALTPHVRGRLSPEVLARLNELASGHLVSQMRGASTIRRMHLGTAHEAYSELMECLLGAPSAPHVPLRVWLLKSLRVLPEDAVASRLTASSSGSHTSNSPRSSNASIEASVAATAAPPERQETSSESPTPTSAHGEAAQNGYGHGHCHSHSHSPRHTTEPGAKTSMLPSYLFLCTAVPPVAASSEPPAVGLEAFGLPSAAASVSLAQPMGQNAMRPAPISPPPPLPTAGTTAAAGIGGGSVSDVSGNGAGPALGYRLVGNRPISPPPPSPTSRGGRAERFISLKPSGLLIQPAAAGQEAEVKLSGLLHKDTVRLISGDLLGERLLFWRTLENLIFVLESLCPLPPEFSHSLRSIEERCLSHAACAGRPCSHFEDWPSYSSPASPRSPSSRGGSRCTSPTPSWQPHGEEIQVELVEEVMTSSSR